MLAVRAVMKPIALAIFTGIAVALSRGQAALGAEGNLDAVRQQLASPVYETRVGAVTQLLQMGQKQRLDKDAIDLLLPPLKKDEWRIKVRILLVLPFSASPDWVIQPLIKALHDREEESSGGGNVPSGACKALAKLGDQRGLKPCEDWLEFLNSHPKAYGDLHSTHVEQAKRYIAELKRQLEKKGSNPQGGANGRQPSRSGTNHTSAAAASRRSP
jgi:hypothetical protein